MSSLLFASFLSAAFSQYTDDDLDIDFDIVEPKKEEVLQNMTKLEYQPQPHDFFFEIIIISILCLYGVNFFIGKSQNEKIATRWMYLLKSIFQENFSHVGIAEKEGEGEILKDGYHAFKYYASGRYNCAYILADLELNRRQDLINLLVGNFLWKEKDRISYEVPISSSTQNPIVFALVTNSVLKNIRTKYEDLKTLTHVVKAPVPSQFTVLTESQDVVEWLINPQIQALIESLAPTIETIYITDQVINKGQYSMHMRCEFIKPDGNREAEDVPKQAQLVLLLADLAHTLKLSAYAKAAADKERAAIEKEKMKEVQAQMEEERLKKKMEQKKKEEEKLKGMSKEKLRKIEEKQYKQELKKKSMKFKTVKA